MSMSIPYFFEPVQLIRDRVAVEVAGDADWLTTALPIDRLDVQAANAEIAAKNGTPASFRELTPKEQKLQRSVIVDGGTLSNFPVWLFDVDNPAQPLKRPTFGFTLTGGKGVGAGFKKAVSRMPWAIRFGFDIFHTSQEAWDARFVSHSTRVRTVTVDAGTVGTTEFNLAPALQDLLIGNGRAAANAFLAKFDLADYENTYHRRFTTTGA
jgi:NTE family protein